jgi:hypothetical protein
MDKKKLFTILSVLLISLLLMAAAPAARSELVALTISNESNDYVTFKLQGPAYYFLMVKPGETTTYTIKRGEYTQKFYSCGAFVDTNLDLTKKQSIYVPPCGEKAFSVDKASSNKVDGGQLIKLVKVTFENDTNYNLVLYLSGTSEYVFFIRSGDEVSYTISKTDYYEVTQWGCPTVKHFNYYPFANKETNLTCPSW